MAWSSLWRRRVAALVTAALISPAVLSLSTSAFAQPAVDAKATLAEGDKAARAKDWVGAAKAYDTANHAQPSAEALEGLANAYYQNGQLGEAYTAYNEWNDKYSDKAPAKKKTVEARLKELADKTGGVTITVNEPGASIMVDDKPMGVSPLAAPLRLTAGPHRLRVAKEGFTLYEQSPNVAAGTTATVAVTLASATAKAKLVVKEKTGKAVRITVDGIDVGDAPWTGEVEPGQHDIGARALGLAAIPQKVNVERGKTQEVELVASSSSAPIKIGTSDAKGLIYLDDKLVGEGSFVGEIPSGTHKLKITREGYDPFEEEFTLKDKEPLSRTITLKLSSKIETGPTQLQERLEGVYGGFNLLAMFTPGGTGNDIEKRLCEDKGTTPELVSCDAPDGLGGGIGGFIGYHWDPVGIELFLAAQYDARVMKADWNAASTNPGIGPDPARLEEYTLRRIGGMGLARVRITLQSTKLRFTAALGAGFARRVMFLQRETTAKDDPAIKDLYVSESTGYWSPIVSFEPAIMYRLGKSTSIGLGLQLFLDAPNTLFSGNDGQNPRSNREGNHSLRGRGLATNEIDLASNIQVYVGPFIGMMFGP